MRPTRRNIIMVAALSACAALPLYASAEGQATFAERLKQALRPGNAGEADAPAVTPPPDMVEELTEETMRAESRPKLPQLPPEETRNVRIPDVSLPWLHEKKTVPSARQAEPSSAAPVAARPASAEPRREVPASPDGALAFPAGDSLAAEDEPPLGPQEAAFKAEVAARFPSDKAFVRRFYADRRYRPVWYEYGKVKRDPSDFLDWMASAFADGLDPARYRYERHRAALQAGAFGPGEDIALTASLLRFISDLQYGASPAELRQQVLAGGGPSLTPEKRLAKILSYPSLGAVPPDERPAPWGEEYEGMKAALAFYRAAAEHGGFPVIPEGPALKPGAKGARVRALRERLRAEGYEVGATGGAAFDASLRSALAEFQRRHGLNADGSAGPKTLEALAVSAEDRVIQIELNLERLRWVPRVSYRRFIRVNIPAYSVKAFDPDKPPLEMKAVVGEAEHQTPSFSSLVEAVVFHPHWYVPERLIREKYLPKILANPGFAYEHNFEIFEKGGDGGWIPVNPRDVSSGGRYRLRQKPGKSNALGKIKFEIRNDMSIYMHGTSAPQLFNESERSLSSGCIRLEKPLDMAFYVLEGQKDFDNEKITAIYDNPNLERRYVTLSDPVPVHVVYWTAWTDDKGYVQFRDDVYGRDADLRAALFPAPEAAAPAL